MNKLAYNIVNCKWNFFGNQDEPSVDNYCDLFASPQRWHKTINSRFLRAQSNQASFYFRTILAILVLFFLDAIREMWKYSSQETTEATHAHVDAEMQVNMRLFRAQIKFYFSCFALFLLLVIRWLVTLISQQVSLLAQSEAAMRPAQSATATTQRLLAQDLTSLYQNYINAVHDKEVTELNEKLAKAKKALEWEKKDMEALKNQSECANKEYERLNEEYRKLQAKIDAGGEPKKDA